MFFSNTAATHIESTVKGRLRDFLQNQLNTHYAETFEKYGGGADVVLRDDEAEAAQQAGKPFIVIDKASHRQGMWGTNIEGVYHRGTRHFFEFRVEVVANEFSGAVTGEANPIASDELLTDALINIIETQWQGLENLGLEEVKIEAEQEVQDNLDRINPHRLSFVAYTIPDAVTIDPDPIDPDPEPDPEPNPLPPTPPTPTITNIQFTSLTVSVVDWTSAATSVVLEYAPASGEWILAANNPTPLSNVTITGLEMGQSYGVRYRYINANGETIGTQSDVTLPVLQPPVPAPAPIISAFDYQSMTIEIYDWSVDAPTCQLQYATDGGEWITVVTNPSTGPLVIGALEASKTYDVRYRLVNNDGESFSPVSSVTTSIAPPVTPPQPNVVGWDYDSIMVEVWDSVDSRAETVFLEYFDEGLWVVDIENPTASEHLIEGLDPSTSYDIRYRAENASGESSGPSVTIVTAIAPPEAPEAPRVAFYDHDTITVDILDWTILAATCVLEYRTDSGDWSTASTNPDPNVDVNLEGLLASTGYELRYLISNLSGEASSESTLITTAPLPVPVAPPAPNITAQDHQSLTVTIYNWTNDASTCYLEYKSTSSSSWIVFVTNPNPEQTITINELAASSEYDVRYRLVNQYGETSGPTSSVTTSALPVPVKPPTPTSSQTTSNSISVPVYNWTTEASTLVLEYKEVSGSSWIAAVTNPPENQTYIITGLTGGASYVLRYRAANQYGETLGDPSSTVILPQVPAPATPPAPQVASVTATMIRVLTQIQTPANTTLYQEYQKGGGAWVVAVTNPAYSQYADITGLNPSTTYLVRYRMVNAGGTSIGPTSSATTSALSPPSQPPAPLVLSNTVNSITINPVDYTTWSPPVATVYLEYKENSESTWTIGVTNPSTTVQTVMSIPSSGVTRTMNVRYRAVNAAGSNSGPQSSRSVAADPTLAPPGEMVVWSLRNNGWRVLPEAYHSTNSPDLYVEARDITVANAPWVVVLTNPPAGTFTSTADLNTWGYYAGRYAYGDGRKGPSVNIALIGTTSTPSTPSATTSTSFTILVFNWTTTAPTLYMEIAETGAGGTNTYTVVATNPTPSASITISGLKPGMQYGIRYRAVTQYGERLSSVRSVTLPAS